MWPRSPSAGERDRSSCVATRSECRRTEPELLCGCEVRGPENGPDRRRLLTLSFFPSLRAAGKIICRTIIRDRKAPDDFFAGGETRSGPSHPLHPSHPFHPFHPFFPFFPFFPSLPVPSHSPPVPSHSFPFLPVASVLPLLSPPPSASTPKKPAFPQARFRQMPNKSFLFIAVARSRYALQHRGSSYHPT